MFYDRLRMYKRVYRLFQNYDSILNLDHQEFERI